jgi:hypothetical protein
MKKLTWMVVRETPLRSHGKAQVNDWWDINVFRTHSGTWKWFIDFRGSGGKAGEGEFETHEMAAKDATKWLRNVCRRTAKRLEQPAKRKEG